MSKIYYGDFYAMYHTGDIDFTEITGSAFFDGWTGSVPKLTTIRGNAYFRNWTGSAPELTYIGGDAFFHNWTGNAPELTFIGGFADFMDWEGSAPKLHTIGGSAHLHGWTGSAPELRTIRGIVYFGGWTFNAPKLNDRYIFSEKIGIRTAICKFDKQEKKYYTGCFSGNSEELIAAYINRYGEDSKYTKQYKKFIKQCEGHEYFHNKKR